MSLRPVVLLAACSLLAPASADARPKGPRRASSPATACSRAQVASLSRGDTLWMLVTAERRGRLTSCIQRGGAGGLTTAVFSGGETLTIERTDSRSLSVLRLRDAVSEPEAARLLGLADRASDLIAERGSPADMTAFWSAVRGSASRGAALAEAAGPAGDRVRGVTRGGSHISFRLPASGRVSQLQAVGVDGEVGPLAWATSRR